MPVPSEPSAASPAAASHRVFSALPVLPGVESEAEWEAHRTGFLRALAPQGFVEEELVLRAALLTWRLNRLSRFDTATAARDETAPAYAERALDRDLARIIRYEAHLTRQLHATLDRLATLQRPRRADAEAVTRRGRPSRLYAPSFPDWAEPSSPDAPGAYTEGAVNPAASSPLNLEP